MGQLQPDHCISIKHATRNWSECVWKYCEACKDLAKKCPWSFSGLWILRHDLISFKLDQTDVDSQKCHGRLSHLRVRPYGSSGVVTCKWSPALTHDSFFSGSFLMDSEVGIGSGRMYVNWWKASESGFIIQIGSIKRFVTSAKRALILQLRSAACRTENDSFHP